MLQWNKKKKEEDWITVKSCTVLCNTPSFLYIFIPGSQTLLYFLRVGLGYSSPGFLKVCHRFYLDMLRRILFGGDCLYGYLTLTCETFKHG